MAETLKKVAVFMDYDNQKVDPVALLRMLGERGRVVLRRAYADWVANQSYRSVVARAGFELIDCPKVGGAHKNAADVRLTLDCLETCYEQLEIEVFVIVTGDADFVPLANKLRMKGRETVVVSHLGGTSEMLQQACDEFIPANRLERLEHLEATDAASREGALRLYQRALTAIERGGRDPVKVNVGLIKQVMLQLNSSFDEDDLGFKTFPDFRAWASKQLRQHDTSTPPHPLPVVQPQAGEEGSLPLSLLIRVYNEALKQEGYPVSLPNLERALQQIQPDFLPQQYGIETLPALARAAALDGFWGFDGGQVRMSPEQRINTTLQEIENNQSAETRRKVLEALVRGVQEWSDDSSLMTLNEIRKRLRQVLHDVVSGADIDGVLRCALTGGAILSAEGMPQESWGLPFTLGGDLNDVETKTLEGYLLRLIGAGSLDGDEYSAAAQALLSSNDSDTIELLLKPLQEQGKVSAKQGRKWKRWVLTMPTTEVEQAVAGEDEPAPGLS